MQFPCPWPLFALSAVVLLLPLIANAGAKSSSFPRSLDELSPVLILDFDQIQSPIPITKLIPIPLTFTEWDRYLQAFRTPALEEFRAALGRALDQYGGRDRGPHPQFHPIPLHRMAQTKKNQSWTGEKILLWLKQSANSKTTMKNASAAQTPAVLQYGDLCLFSVGLQPPQDWRQDCGWLLVGPQLGDAVVARPYWLTSADLFQGDNIRLWVCPIQSGVTASRILSSTLLAYHKGRKAFHESAIHLNFRRLLLKGVEGAAPPLSRCPITDDDTLLSGLNQSQRQAVTASLTAATHPGSAVLIQGPPGTGKTTMIVSMIQGLLRLSKRIVVTAPTNVAVLDVARRLIQRSAADGHALDPKRVLIVANIERDAIRSLIDSNLEDYVLSLQQDCIESIWLLAADLSQLLKNADQNDKSIRNDHSLSVEQQDQLQLKNRRRYLRRFAARLTDFKRAKSYLSPWLSQQIRDEIDAIATSPVADSSLYSRSISLITDLNTAIAQPTSDSDRIAGASLIFTTLSGTKSSLMLSYPFQVAIVDECAQAVEAEMLALWRSSLEALILVGDPKQLSATTFSSSAVAADYSRSLFERLSDGAVPIHLLNEQYRMDPRINAFPNQCFYQGRVQDGANVRAYRPRWDMARFPALLFVAHTGSKAVTDCMGSWRNPLEAHLIRDRIRSFLETVDDDVTIGVIVPYRAQRQLLEQQLTQDGLGRVVVNTVDGFQGRECDVICLALTRTGRSSAFVDDESRMNVALTRARRSLWVFGDQKAFAAIPSLTRNGPGQIWRQFAAHCRQSGAVESVNLIENVNRRDTATTSANVKRKASKKGVVKQSDPKAVAPKSSKKTSVGHQSGLKAIAPKLPKKDFVQQSGPKTTSPESSKKGVELRSDPNVVVAPKSSKKEVGQPSDPNTTTAESTTKGVVQQSKKNVGQQPGRKTTTAKWKKKVVVQESDPKTVSEPVSAATITGSASAPIAPDQVPLSADVSVTESVGSTADDTIPTASLVPFNADPEPLGRRLMSILMTTWTTLCSRDSKADPNFF